MEEYEKAGMEYSFTYSDILTYHILRRDGNYQLPRDTQFVEAIENRDAYHMLKPFQIFLFERLENSVHGEYNDVCNKCFSSLSHSLSFPNQCQICSTKAYMSDLFNL